MIRQGIKATTLAIALFAGMATTHSALAGQIETATIKSTVYDKYVNLGGTVIPFKEITVTAQQAGQINYIAGIEGDRFEAGALLISTDDEILVAQRNAAMAQWDQASFAYQNAMTQYNREVWSPKTEQSMPGMAMPGLMDQMFVKPFSNTMGYGDNDVDKQANRANAFSKVQTAKSMMQQLKSRIDEIDARLSDTKSTAPFRGVIVKKMVETGDTVQPGQPLLMFSDNTHLSIEVNIPVNLMLGITKGTVFKARLANKVPTPVRVAQIFPVANSKQHTVTVKFDLPIGTPAAPGMYAEVSVKNSSSQNQAFPTVPKSAIVKRGSLPTIYTLDTKTNKIHMKVIRTGTATRNSELIVLSGVKEHETVIINPPSNIVSGLILENGRLVAAKPKTDDND